MQDERLEFRSQLKEVRWLNDQDKKKLQHEIDNAN